MENRPLSLRKIFFWSFVVNCALRNTSRIYNIGCKPSLHLENWFIMSFVFMNNRRRRLKKAACSI